MPEMGDLLREGSVTDPFFEVLNDGDWNASIGRSISSIPKPGSTSGSFRANMRLRCSPSAWWQDRLACSPPALGF